MSEQSPQEPTFVPESSPPQLDEPTVNTVVTAQEDSSGETPAQAAPQSTGPHLGMSVDERAYQQYQSLAKAVLDSAELANRSAEAAMSAGSQLRQATTDFRTLTDSGQKKAMLLLGITGAVLVVCLLFFLTMGVRLVSRINQLDTMITAVGKRVVELNSGMDSLNSVNQTVQELAGKQAELTQAQSQIESRIDAALKQSESLVQKVPAETAKQVAATNDNLTKQVQSLNGRLQSQANAVQALGSEVKAMKNTVANVENLNRDVQALVTLQKERYLEALQKNNAQTARERAVQYPRVPASAPAAKAAEPVASPAGPVSGTIPR